MYNFEDESIPSFLPVSAEVQLRPWFSRAVLDAGLGLIRKEKVGALQVLRGCVGGCIDGEATVTLQFEASKKLSQGFVLRNNYCSLCGFSARRERCAHMAALAILSLVVGPGQTQAKPVSLVFAASYWARIGEFLYDWLSRGKYSAALQTRGQSHCWSIETADGGLQAEMAPSWLPVADQLFPGKLSNKEKVAAEGAVARLNAELQLLTMTDGERQLQKAGSAGVAWKKDVSFWSWLVRMLFIRHGAAAPKISRDPATRRFQLQFGEAGTPGAVLFDLPPDRTWDFVRNVAPAESGMAILPAGRECYRLFFNKDNSLEVQPSLRLADGRVLDRQELAGNRLAGAWYLEGEGFLPVLRLPAEGEVKNPRRQANSLSLLGFLEAQESRDTPFTVAPNDLQAFLDENRNPLKYPGNIVDPALLDLEIRELPDRLIIDSFEERDDWCYLSCRYGLGDTAVSLGEIRKAQKHKLRCLPGRRWLKLDDTPLSWLHELLEERYEAGGGGRLRLSYLELFRLTAMVPEVELRLGQKAVKDHLAGLLDVERWTDGSLLTNIPAHLRSYQSNGLAWLLRLCSFGIGGLLADDMGLGKTHQGLALLQVLLAENREGSILVICPASVVLHWAEKIDSYYQGLDYSVYYGGGRDPQKLREHNVIITTYGVVRQDIDLLRSLRFDLVLLDEIQQLKNHTTAIHQAVAGLNSRVKIGLTGTPVENSLQDLRSLFAICLPGLLGSERQFARQYGQPIAEYGSREARERLSRLIHPFILRRSRSQVLTELPDIIEDDRLCELSNDQAGLYREILESGAGDLAGLTDETAAIPYMHILAIITRLKQLCCHPSLLMGDDDPESYSCGKWDLFVELSEELLAAEMKFVVFSQYTRMLDLLEGYFRKAGIGIAGLRGDMPVAKRQRMIERFNTDPGCRVFCASLLAGGTGIDLTGAQAVIHYDRWWNPAKEEQATARVHRMGQKAVVQVFRLITVDTLEEKIHRLLQEKRELAKSLLHEDEAGIIKQLDREQLIELFRTAPVPVLK